MICMSEPAVKTEFHREGKRVILTADCIDEMVAFHFEQMIRIFLLKLKAQEEQKLHDLDKE